MYVLKSVSFTKCKHLYLQRCKSNKLNRITKTNHKKKRAASNCEFDAAPLRSVRMTDLPGIDGKCGRVHYHPRSCGPALPDILDTEVRPVHGPADSLVDKSASIPLFGENEIGLQHALLLGRGQVHKPA